MEIIKVINGLRWVGKISMVTLMSIYKATVEIIWGMAGIFLISALLLYLRVDNLDSLNNFIIQIWSFINSNIKLFWLAFLAYFLITYLRDIKDPKEEQKGDAKKNAK